MNILKHKYRILGVFLLIVVIVGVYNVYKPLPEGLSYEGELVTAGNIRFLKDITYRDQEGKAYYEHEIFNEIVHIITSARQTIILDMFLFSDLGGEPDGPVLRPLSGELTDLLVLQKKKYPQMQIIVITDPINTVYGGLEADHLTRLEASGIDVAMTELDKMRDSNPLYSSIWRTLFRFFGNTRNGKLPNPLGEGRVSLRSYMRLLNFKANHRKILIADSADGYVGLVSSANAHDGSSFHSNVAVRFSGPAVRDLIESERAVIAFSGGPEINAVVPEDTVAGQMRMRLLTESKIRTGIINTIEKTGQGDMIRMVMFYLSHRDIIRALKNAHHRGVDIRIILDPNKDAFGREKNGIPNRQVANELHKSGIAVKWYDTRGEQCHAKFIATTSGAGSSNLIIGSANFTRRNLNDLNLETDVYVEGPSKDPLFQEVDDYFTRLWENHSQAVFTLPFAVYEDTSSTKKILYFVMELLGVSTF
ncbi:MAG: phospholipase [Desulfobacteraceae bacterium]|nr:phospholipase [Desulfobacteraceae bacterium]